VPRAARTAEPLGFEDTKEQCCRYVIKGGTVLRCKHELGLVDGHRALRVPGQHYLGIGALSHPGLRLRDRGPSPVRDARKVWMFTGSCARRCQPEAQKGPGSPASSKPWRGLGAPRCPRPAGSARNRTR
jgi:hypothetical protein